MSFTVIGVAQPRPGGGLTQDSDSDIYIPVSTAAARFGEWIERPIKSDPSFLELSRIVVVLRKDAEVQKTLPLINSVLEPFITEARFRLWSSIAKVNVGQASA